MYRPPPPSSASSSSQPSLSSSGLTRYCSAPGSLLNSAVDSVINSSVNRDHFSSSSTTLGSSSSSPPLVSSHHHQQQQHHHHYSDQSPCQQQQQVNSSNDQKDRGLDRSYGFNEGLLRQKSSPAGFLSHLSAADNGFSITRCTRGYGSHSGSPGVSRLSSQLSFTRQDSLSHISEVSENVDGINSESSQHNAAHSYATSSFGMDSWENGNSIVFSAPSNKRAKTIDEDVFNCLNALDSQFSLPHSVEKLLNVPEDTVPCKIRAKRGCATHPRSIAERERRTRISGKLKKLQELVPNMDKQTSYSDMLDLAVEHIKGLQNEIQTLHKDLESCKCGCKPNT